MPDLDFDKIPPQLHWLVAIGAGIYGAWMIYKGLTGPKNGQPAADNAVELAMKLADSQLRHELSQIIAEARMFLQNQVLQLSERLREERRADLEHQSQSRSEIYRQMRTLQSEVSDLRVKVAEMQGRPRSAGR